MSRYIDADKVMEEINRIGGHNLDEWNTLGVKALICRQDTADVVEVVRCKDCIYHRTPDCSLWYGTVGVIDYIRDMGDNFYCSCGEKDVDDGT